MFRGWEMMTFRWEEERRDRRVVVALTRAA